MTSQTPMLHPVRRTALLLALPLVLALLTPADLRAQEFDPTDTSAHPAVNTFALEYDLVFRAVKTALEGSGYTINYSSKKKMLIETEFRPLANEENFFEVMEKYGNIPYLRSPGWTVGRVQLTVRFDTVNATSTKVNVQANLSGYEGRFENRWIYWNSNGTLDREAMAAITAAVTEETRRSRSGQ